MKMPIASMLSARVLAICASALAVSACSTVQPNPRIGDAQNRLSAAYNDKETAERGQGALTNAKAALLSAEDEWNNGDRERSDHKLMMGQTYLDIAETRGQQAKFERENIRLSNEARLADKNRQIADKDEQIAGKNRQIAGKNDQLDEKARQLATAKEQLLTYNMKLDEMGSTMVLQDVSFETGKAQLLSGGVNRMQPLINFLRLSPETQVRIEGYTDNVGGRAYNQQLSVDRANSVKAVLTEGGIAGERISTVGFGFAKPVATNSTVAGRQSNRRVEVTLLKQPAK